MSSRKFGDFGSSLLRYGTFGRDKAIDIEQINRASQSPKCKNLLHFDIQILIPRYENNGITLQKALRHSSNWHPHQSGEHVQRKFDVLKIIYILSSILTVVHNRKLGVDEDTWVVTA